VSINYLVRSERVVDIYLNGTVSDLALRRDEFTSIIASGGADALIKRLAGSNRQSTWKVKSSGAKGSAVIARLWSRAEGAA